MCRMAVLEEMRLSLLPSCQKQTRLFNPCDTYLPADCYKEYHCMILTKNLICKDTVLERDSGRQHAVAKEGDIAGSALYPSQMGLVFYIFSVILVVYVSYFLFLVLF